MEPIRIPLTVKNLSRDETRVKGSWGINVFVENTRIRKRPGVSVLSERASPGQGVFNYHALVVSIQSDVLQVGATSYPL